MNSQDAGGEDIECLPEEGSGKNDTQRWVNRLKIIIRVKF